MAKSPCPISKTQFLDKAEAVKITIGGAEIIADKREFSTGSFGWYHNGKTTITVDGKPLSIQIGLNLTVVGRKRSARLGALALRRRADAAALEQEGARPGGRGDLLDLPFE